MYKIWRKIFTLAEILSPVSDVGFFLKGKNRGILHREHSDILEEILTPTQEAAGPLSADSLTVVIFGASPIQTLGQTWKAAGQLLSPPPSLAWPSSRLRRESSSEHGTGSLTKSICAHYVKRNEDIFVVPVNTSLLVSSWCCGSPIHLTPAFHTHWPNWAHKNIGYSLISLQLLKEIQMIGKAGDNSICRFAWVFAWVKNGFRPVLWPQGQRGNPKGADMYPFGSCCSQHSKNQYIQVTVCRNVGLCN